MRIASPPRPFRPRGFSFPQAPPFLSSPLLSCPLPFSSPSPLSPPAPPPLAPLSSLPLLPPPLAPSSAGAALISAKLVGAGRLRRPSPLPLRRPFPPLSSRRSRSRPARAGNLMAHQPLIPYNQLPLIWPISANTAAQACGIRFMTTAPDVFIMSY